MKKTAFAFIVAFFTLCSSNNESTINPQLLPYTQSSPLSAKKALFVTRQVSVELDTSCDGTVDPVIMVDPCEAFLSKDECDSLRLAAVTSFLDTSMIDGGVMYLSQQQLNTRPLNKDAGGQSCKTAISTFPATFKTSDFTGLDSTVFTIDSIAKDHTVFGKLDNNAVSIRSGVTLTLVDTISVGSNCTRHCILTQKITNNGFVNPTKELLWDYFGPWY